MAHRSNRSLQSGQRGYLYVTEDELVQRLLADPDLAGQAVDLQALGNHLRENKITIDCGHAAST